MLARVELITVLHSKWQAGADQHSHNIIRSVWPEVSHTINVVRMNNLGNSTCDACVAKCLCFSLQAEFHIACPYIPLVFFSEETNLFTRFAHFCLNQSMGARQNMSEKQNMRERLRAWWQ